MRAFLNISTIIFMLLICIETHAQYYEGDVYVPACSHKGTQDLWEIIAYRPGVASWDKTEGSKGKIRFSESCIEIECHQLVLSFGVKEYDRLSPRNFKVYRNNPDDLFDYMEVKPALGSDRGLYWVFLGRLDERGYMIGTIQLTCRPYKRPNVANPKPSVPQQMSR